MNFDDRDCVLPIHENVTRANAKQPLDGDASGVDEMLPVSVSSMYVYMYMYVYIYRERDAYVYIYIYIYYASLGQRSAVQRSIA